MRDFILVYMVEPAEVDAQFTEWPLHMTLLPWFRAPDIEEVVSVLQNVISKHKATTVQVGERAHYGVQRKLAVMKVHNTKALQDLHEDLVHMVTDKGWELQGRYIGSQYTPHVTRHGGRDASGELRIDRIAIAEALPQNYRKIVAYVELADG